MGSTGACPSGTPPFPDGPPLPPPDLPTDPPGPGCSLANTVIAVSARNPISVKPIRSLVVMIPSLGCVVSHSTHAQLYENEELLSPQSEAATSTTWKHA